MAKPLKMQVSKRPAVIQIYAEETGFHPAPDSVVWRRLLKWFPGEFDEALWRKIVGDWVGKDYNKKNIDRLYACYKAGTVERKPEGFQKLPPAVGEETQWKQAKKRYGLEEEGT